MPKDPTKNVDRYKVRGGDINEFEYDQNQQAFTDKKAKGATKLIPGTPPEEKTTKKSAKKQATKASKSSKKAAVATRGASAKKLAARKAAKKK